MTNEDIDWEQLDWKKELNNNVVSIRQLKKYVDISDEEELKLLEVSRIHPINIPRYYLSLIHADDPHDPVRKMCFPSVDEFVIDGSEPTKPGRGVRRVNYTPLAVLAGVTVATVAALLGYRVGKKRGKGD